MIFSLIKRNKAFQKSYMKESGCQEFVSCRYDASKDLGVEIEETDGSSSSSRQKECDFSVPIDGNIWP